MLLLPGVLAMAGVVVASNILVQFLLGDWLTWGALTYPLSFLVTDVTNRIYGVAHARRVVLAGFAVGVVCSLIGAGLGVTTPRIALASGAAFLCGQMLDVLVFDRLRHGTWWRAPLISSLMGSILDTVLFFSIAFAGIDPATPAGWASAPVPLLGLGPELPLWQSLALADWSVKMALALASLGPFRLIVRKMLRLGRDPALT